MTPLFEVFESDSHELAIAVDGELAIRLSGEFAPTVAKHLMETPNAGALSLVALGVYLGACASVYGRVDVTQIDALPSLIRANEGEVPHDEAPEPAAADELAEQGDHSGTR